MNTALADLDCSWNNLTSLDVRNNNNTNFTYFSTFNNSALSCIDVDDSTYSANNWSNISSQSYFSNNCSQLQQVKTYIPDDNFEQKLINLGYDNVLDDSITTASINSISSLFIQNSSISDLTGIEDFTALSKLWCFNNQLTNLDLSSNTSLIELSCGQNNIVNLDLTNNTALKKLYCSSNQISNLSVSSNVALAELLCSGNQLTSLDVSNNTSLTELDCSLNNIISIDLSNNTSLTYFKVGFNPPLSFLDLTGVSCSLISNLSSFYRTPNLTCIRVTDVNCWNALNLSSFILNQHYYSTNCPPPSGIEEQFINNELISITDILGKETPYKKNTPLFYLYDDGTVEKKIVVE
jgi:Leucine-rich repeat (LRR) protein